MVFSSSHVQMWELDHKESWVLKNWCFWTVVLEKTLESSLDCKEIQPVHPKGNQSWIFFGRTDAEAEAPILWPPDVKNWLIGKDPDAGKDWGQEEKGITHTHFWTVLEKTLESPLNCKEIKAVNPKGNQLWIFIGRTVVEASILWPPDVKSWHIEKDSDAGKDWRQKEKGSGRGWDDYIVSPTQYIRIWANSMWWWT